MGDYLIEVSGAGPAGLAAALTVVREGGRAIVYERAHTVGQRFHDDFQGLENWTTPGDVLDELAEAGIGLQFDYLPVRETVVFDPDGRDHVYRANRPIFYLVRRGSAEGTLNSGLKAQALSAGVEIRFDETRRHLPDGGIVAEGPRGSDAIAVGYVFETAAADCAFAALSDQLAPKGYAYYLVWKGRGTVASCMFDDFHHEKDHLARAVKFFQDVVGMKMIEPRRFGGVGNFSAPESARQGNLLFAGEAAGFQDALWGFGMRYALISGHLAARALLDSEPARYDQLWRKRLGGLLRTGIVNRYLYERLGNRGYAAFARSIDSTDVCGWLRRHYNPTWFKRALFPVARRSVTTNRQDRVCVVEGCDCTWCRCQHDEASELTLENQRRSVDAASR